MVCSTCQIAGDMNERGLWFMEHDRTREAENAFRESEVMHDGCEYPFSCPCQHHTRSRLHESWPHVDVPGRPE